MRNAVPWISASLPAKTSRLEKLAVSRLTGRSWPTAALPIRTGAEPIGAVLKRLGVRYVGWFNRKYGRVGHLFQDRFRSQPVEDDAYFVTLIRYVWRNPVKAGLVEHAEDYLWSSRRLLGVPSDLIDEAGLRGLLRDASLEDIATEPDQPPAGAMKGGRAPRLTDEAAAALLRSACRAQGWDSLVAMPFATRWRALREVRTRGATFEQLERVCGISASSLRRSLVTGDPSQLEVVA